MCSGAVKGGTFSRSFSCFEKRLGGYSSFGTQYFDDENFIAQYPFYASVCFLHCHSRYSGSRDDAECRGPSKQ